MAWAAVWTNQLNALTEAQMQNNVDIIYAFFKNLGWNDLPIAAMLGNMAHEGELNPAQWEAGKVIEGTGLVGFGLCQWTPWTKLANFLGENWRDDYTGQLRRIEWEAVPGHEGNVIDDGQWIPVASYDYYTFQEFAHDTTHDLVWLVKCFLYSYERGEPKLEMRIADAEKWLAYIQGNPPTPPIPPTPPTPTSRRKMPVWMMLKPNRIYRR